MCDNGLAQDNIQQNLCMIHFGKDPPDLVHGRESGSLEHRESVVSFYGWQPMTVFGQQTGWREGTCHTQITTPYVTKKRKQSTISSPHVSSPDSSGFSSCGMLV
jgi:hypothetical protein